MLILSDYICIYKVDALKGMTVAIPFIGQEEKLNLMLPAGRIDFLL